ncbi:MAG: type III-B CRISPR-associated protein Cas10/Cmr2 [Planctomycetota bacterium]
MAELQRLHFSFGPVQSFVSQSRRTRDLWTSSFILSRLAESAMSAIQPQFGKIVLPSFDPALANRNDRPTANVPNRFLAELNSGVDGLKAGNAAAQALRDEWKRMAESVWTKFVQPIATTDSNTRKIWDRQINRFWDITWGISEEDILPRRKNWRTGPLTVEEGDHCTMTGQWQELSGFIRSREKDKQNKFWEALRNVRDVGCLDLDTDERLCSIALVKRFYPKAAGIKANNWPSTAYVAAIPWLRAVAENPKTQTAAKAYGSQVRELAENSLGERQTQIPSLERLKAQTGDFLKLDGNFFQKNAIGNAKVTPFEPALEVDDDTRQRRGLQKALDDLSKAVGEKPSAFYAVLLMDGDSMGALLSEARKHPDNGEQQATRALGQFSQSVPNIVGQHDGITIYAGGDDVLAMLPLDSALGCAMKLADAYREVFKKQLGPSLAEGATLSGAIVYAHYHTPLRDVLSTAHHLLDDVAKDATGRDSLAMAVFKSSGITAQWSAPWKHIRQTDANSDASNIIDELICDLGQRKHDRERADGTERSAEFSSGFFYNVRERFAALTDKALTKPGEFGRLSEDLSREGNNLLRKVLVADYLRCVRHRDGEASAEDKRQDAEAAIERLLNLCQQVTRRKVSDDPQKYEPFVEHHTLGIDGALLVRFLTSDGKEDAE